MTRYLLYFLTGFAVATVILFFRGYASVPQSAFSNAALVGAMALFGVASWLTLFRVKIGTLLALLSLLAMLPWVVSAWMRIAELEVTITQILIIVLAVLSGLVLISLIVSLRYTFGRGSWGSGTTAPGIILKILLTLIPLAVLVAWFIVEPKL
ncbi:hypothetical protein DXT99_14685 [Pontibacter diazotrophicus]|uniref:Uncharacterized protein n=1 Tax=Pontibacter diazotrophicus TaxID=1400979 RepID=A0A3D8LAF8_9BACT|nr:hypothetical protein [Pontibacter diazotrophicus]RDV14368.1 hypothetical protein DXT99_14685 [Pontibacter diazotrophicus]